MLLVYHDLLIHNYGPQQRFASVHIEVDSRWNLMKAHDVVDLIEKDVRKTLGVHLVCHLDPVPIDNPKYLEIHRIVKGCLKGLNQDFRMHDFRILPNNHLQFDLVVPEGNQVKEQEIKETIHQQLSVYKEAYKIEMTLDHHYLL